MNELHYGSLSVIILILGLCFLVYRWPKSVHYTFSQHAAASRQSSLYYSILFAVVLMCASVFFFHWFIPNLRLGFLYAVVIAVSFLSQQVCTFVPEKDKGVNLHRQLAGLSALLLFVSQLLILCYIPTILTVICVLVMAWVIARVMIMRNHLKYALLYQVAYYLAFSMPIIWLSVAK